MREKENDFDHQKSQIITMKEKIELLEKRNIYLD